jgi:hypothetical protein
MLMNDAKLDKCAACELAKGGADPAAAAEPEPVNAFAALIPKGSWSCSSCMLMNDAKLDKCAACELSKDGVAAETDGLAILKSDKDAPTFTFGAGPGATLTTDATTDTTTTTTPAFNFGAGDTPTFTFGGVTTAATPDKTAAPSTVPATGFTFGEGNTNISFGNVATDNVSTGFNAGSFKFEATTSLESQNTTVDPSAAVFKEEDSKDTGMETDQKHFEIRGKAYEFVTDAETKKSKYSERGVGNAFVSTVEVKEKLHGRIVMHTDKTKRLVLNVPIFPGMTKEVFNNTYVKFLTYDADKTAHVYLIRVKTAEDAKALLAGIDKAVNKMETFNKKK